MDITEVLKMVADMRKAQKNYFKESKRNPAIAKSLLIHSKELETKVDRMLTELLPDYEPKQQEFF